VSRLVTWTGCSCTKRRKSWSSSVREMTKYSSLAPRVGLRAKSTSWRSTSLGWRTGSRWMTKTWNCAIPAQLWPKSDPFWSGFGSSQLLFSPRISFEGLGSILGQITRWSVVNCGDKWALAITSPGNSQTKRPFNCGMQSMSAVNFGPKTLCYEAFCRQLIFLLDLSWPLMGSKPSLGTRRIFSHLGRGTRKELLKKRCNFVGSNICKILIIFHFCIFYLQMSHCPQLPNKVTLIFSIKTDFDWEFQNFCSWPELSDLFYMYHVLRSLTFVQHICHFNCTPWCVM